LRIFVVVARLRIDNSDISNIIHYFYYISHKYVVTWLCVFLVPGQHWIPCILKTKLLHEISSGMSYLHSRHILHCDLKLQNILLGEQLNAKVSYIITRMTYKFLLLYFISHKQTRHCSMSLNNLFIYFSLMFLLLFLHALPFVMSITDSYYYFVKNRLLFNTVIDQIFDFKTSYWIPTIYWLFTSAYKGPYL